MIGQHLRTLENIARSAKWKAWFALAETASLLRNGRFAPESCVLYIDPRSVQSRVSRKASVPAYQAMKQKRRFFNRTMILRGDWDQTNLEPFVNEKLSIVQTRATSNRSWEDLGLFERARTRAGADMEAVKKRYGGIDALIRDIKAGKPLVPSAEIEGKPDTLDDIFICVGRNAELIFARNSGGNHRLAIAQALGIDRIPVVIGGVHLQALENGAYSQFLQRHKNDW